MQKGNEFRLTKRKKNKAKDQNTPRNTANIPSKGPDKRKISLYGKFLKVTSVIFYLYA